MANSLKDRMSQREAALRSNSANKTTQPNKSNQNNTISEQKESEIVFSGSVSDTSKKQKSIIKESPQLRRLKRTIEQKKQDVSELTFHPFRMNKKNTLKESMQKRDEMHKTKKKKHADDEDSLLKEETSLLKESKAAPASVQQEIAKNAEMLQKELRAKQEERYEQELSARSLEKSKSQTKKWNGLKHLKKGFSIFLIILSVYMLFLVFGILNTDYVYNENNEVVPKRVSLSEINQLKNFQAIATQYYACRSVYEDVLMLDYRFANAESQEELVLISAEYWKITDKMKDIGVAINALKLPSEYTNVKNQLLTWTSEYMYWYCQSMSYSISDNSMEDYEKAVEFQSSTYTGFMIITRNLISLGTAVPGAENDVESMSSWSPEKYVDDQTGGLY